MLKIECVVCGALEENAYIVENDGHAGVFLIDPGDDYAALVRALAGRKLSAICLTHAHYDHMLAAPGLIADTGAKLYVGAKDMPALNDDRLNLYNAAWSRLPAPQGLKARAYGEELEVCGVILDRGFVVSEGYIQITIVPHEDGTVTIHIRDSAREFNPFALDTEGISLEKGRGLDALGIKMIKSKAKESFYRRYAGFNTLVVRV